MKAPFQNNQPGFQYHRACGKCHPPVQAHIGSCILAGLRAAASPLLIPADLYILLAWTTLVPSSSWAGTVAWWSLEEGPPNATATGTVVDSAHGFDATPHGQPIYRTVSIPGWTQPNSLALEFNGSSSYLSVADRPAFYLTNSLTLEAFICYSGRQRTQSMQSQIVFRGDDRGSLDPYSLDVTPDGRLRFHMADAQDTYAEVLSPSTIPTNQFMHVAGSYDASSGMQTLYINGKQVAVQTTSVRPFGALSPEYLPGIGIGNVQSPTYPEYFWGLISEVRISDVALSPAEFLFNLCQIAPTNVVPPKTQTTETGSTVIFRVWASGDPPLNYEWFYGGNSGPSGNTNSFLVLSNVQPSQSGSSFTVVITNRCGAVTSSPAMLSVIPPVPRRTVPVVNLTGDAGSFLHLSCADTPGPGATWQPLDAVTLTATQQFYPDLTLPLPSSRFYRTWQTNVPSLTPALEMRLATQLTLTGAIGSNVRIDRINRFGPTDAWVTLDTVTLTNTTQPYFDYTMFHQPPRLYRVVPVP